MGMFDNLMGGTKKPSLVPDVLQMRASGMEDPQILQQLQSKGLNIADIQDALMQADIKTRVAGAGPRGPLAPMPGGGAPPELGPGPQKLQSQMAPPPGPGPMGPPPLGPPQMGPPQFGPGPMGPPQMGPMGPPQMGPMGPPQMGPPQMGPMGPPEMGPMGFPGPSGIPPEGRPEGASEELVESIVNERLKDFSTKLDNLENFRTNTKEDIQEMRDTLADVKEKYIALQEESSVRLEEYSKELENVGAQIKAMQKVLQKVFPAIAENVHELSQIVQDLKGVKKVNEEE